MEIRLPVHGGGGGVGLDSEGMLHPAHAGTGHPHRERSQCRAPWKDEGVRVRGGEGERRGGAPAGTAATSTSPGRILLSRMGCAQVWGVAVSLWFPLRYPSRTERRPLARGNGRSVKGVWGCHLPHPPTPCRGSLTHGWLPLLVVQAVGVRFGLLAGRAGAGDTGNIGEVTRRGLGHGGVAAVQQELAVIDDPGA